MNILLIDCNNFFVSCERVFSPNLQGKAVVILSNNDGCIIARSNEAKALGVPMGAPLFQWQEFLEKNKVIVRSSNYSLYGNMSQRVMETLSQFAEIEIYSIDEAFLMLNEPNSDKIAKKIKTTILQWTGIPVSIGIAPTKTLAKAANHLAKKEKNSTGICSLFNPNEIDTALDTFPAIDVWGIGRRYGKRLARYGIVTAKQLRDADDTWIKKNLSVIGLKTALELRGTPCLELNMIASSKKSICSSRSFGRPVTSQEELHEAAATYTAKAAEKIRKQHSVATALIVFAEKHPFEIRETSYATITLPEPTNYTPQLIQHAKSAINTLFKTGTAYRKVGIILEGLIPESCYQLDLFTQPKEKNPKQATIMQLMDQMNKHFGRRVVHSAAEGVKQGWKGRQEIQSNSFTTEWDQILTIKI